VSRTIKFVLVAVLAVIVLGWIASVQFQPKSNTFSGKPHIQKPALDFVLKNLEGRDVALSSYKGKLIYLKFWASWCGDCIKQVVPQRNLQKALAGDSSIVFVHVSIDDDEQKWRESVARNKLNAVELWSSKGDAGNVAENYDLDQIPRYILIGKNGLVLDNNAPKPSEIDPSYFSKYL
jgi:thiol-disulfide isomerase/thioredoxin